MTDLSAIAQALDHAARHAQAIDQLSQTGNALALEQAYAVQKLSIDRRIGRGEKVVGIKMGFTSRAKMEQMGVDDLIWGFLTDAMSIADGQSVELDAYVHPRVEPEIAFLLQAPLAGDISVEQARQAVGSVAVAMEVIDSRYRNFRFSLEDVVADNCSSSGYVIGPWQSPPDDLRNLGMALSFDGVHVQTGSSNDILGDPYQSLVEAARLASQSGVTLEAGWIVLAGAATAAEALRPGTSVSATAEQLGDCSMAVACGGQSA